MRKIDNFELIKELLKFENPDEFYFIEIIQRKKDNINLDVNSRIIAFYSIRSIKEYNNLAPVIKAICEATGSRAYINLNRRSYKVTAFQMLKLLTNYVTSANYKAIAKLFSSCVCSFKHESNPTWILDIDPDENGNLPTLNEIISMTQFIDFKCQPIGNKLVTKIPTLNGLHLIVKPFNCKTFTDNNLYKNITIHKNSPTLLYFKQK